MSTQKRIRRISLYLILLSLPYLIAWISQGSEYYFGGLLLNPIDGYSYFAKMKEGFDGQWLFTLPFTAQPGNGAFLFIFYIFLGHLCRITHIPIPLMFHLVRFLGSGLFLYQLSKFIDRFVKLKNIKAEQIFNFIFLSSGLGWIALFAQYKSADLWVAEAYPFYAALISPHFIFGLYFFLYVLTNLFADRTIARIVKLVFVSLLLALTMPFGTVILVMVIALYWATDKPARTRTNFLMILLVSLPAGLVVLWQYWQTISNPALVVWNRQNITINPPYWDLLLSFSPMVLLAFYALYKWKSMHYVNGYRLAATWFGICLIIILLPFSLQRRFLFGFAIAVTVLGLYGLDDILDKFSFGRILQRVVFILPVITIGMLFVLMGFGIMQKSDYSYLSLDEIQAYQWIADIKNNDLVVFSENIPSLRIPYYTGKRVFYAHPFETIDAAKKEAQTRALLSCSAMDEVNAAIFMRDQDIDLVLLSNSDYIQADCFHGYPILNENQAFILLDVGE